MLDRAGHVIYVPTPWLKVGIGLTVLGGMAEPRLEWMSVWASRPNAIWTLECSATL